MVKAVAYAKQAGLRYVYRPDPFEQWGHFRLKSRSFPNGDESLAACAALAGREGVRLGIHTLSNFTTMNDPYVTPQPDRRLQPIGTANLTEAITAAADTVPIDEPWPFTAVLFKITAVIGDELIEYDTVSEQAPWKLLGVKCGAYGTNAGDHKRGDRIARLWDHPYDVVFPNAELQDEFAQRITELMNKASLRQIYSTVWKGCMRRALTITALHGLSKTSIENRNLLMAVEGSAASLMIGHGGQTLSFSCKFEGDPKPEVSVKIWQYGPPMTVTAPS